MIALNKMTEINRLIKNNYCLFKYYGRKTIPKVVIEHSDTPT